MKGVQHSFTIGQIFANKNRNWDRYISRLAPYQLSFRDPNVGIRLFLEMPTRNKTVHDPLQNGSSRQLDISHCVLFTPRQLLLQLSSDRLLDFHLTLRVQFSAKQAHILWHVAQTRNLQTVQDT